MTERNELKDRPQELFSSPPESDLPERSHQPEPIDTPIALAPADESTLVASIAASGTAVESAQVASSSVVEASVANVEAAGSSFPGQQGKQQGARTASSSPAESLTWRKQMRTFAFQPKTATSGHSRLQIFSNRSLRFKLIFAFLLVTVITVGVLTLVSDRTIRNELTQDVSQSMKSLAVSKAQEVGSLLTNQVNILRSLALNDVINEGLAAANAAYTGDSATIQAEIDKLDQQWRSADAANNNANPLVQAHLNNPMASALTRFRESFPNNVEVFVTDQYGALLASTNRTSDYDQADEEWWQATYNGGQGDVYIGQPEFDASSATLSVNIAVPLYARDTRRVAGVLRTTLDIGTLQKILAQAGHADLLLPSGDMIRTEGGLVPANPETLDHIKGSASTGNAEFTYNGSLSLVSQAPVTAVDSAEAAPVAKLRWTFIVAQDSADAMGPVNTAAQATLFSGVGTLLVAALLALGLAQILVRPITRLTMTAEKIAEGDLNVQARVESSDEIGKLATTFNLMTAQLRETLGSLEQRVAVRTRDLTLASEVGRGVSNMRELNTLLGNAVDLIRERFDLYYTQVYLTDAARRRLVLRAGTGSVGQELMQRVHHLPIGPGSINGTAAAEKRVVIVADTASSDTFRPNPLLPDTRSEMAVPLIAGNRVVGVLDLQSTQPGALTDENLPAFEALAGQMAIAIENAALFAEVEQARAEVEAQARRLTQSGWHEFLDAVNRGERLGYIFDQRTIMPLTEPLLAAADPAALDVPILVTGEPIGRIQLERDTDEDQPWAPADSELVSSIASRVATQVENLRLLAQAEQYRAEAEVAMRRLTREGWDALQARGELAPGYVYDHNEVKPLPEKNNEAAEGILKQPFVVRDEPIGELAVDVEANFDEAAEIIAAVAERLSGHIESLRLSEQNEKRAQEMETVAEVSSTTATLLDPDRLLYAVVDLTKERFDLYHAHIYLADASWQTLLLAAGAGEVGRKMVAEEHAIAVDAERSLVARAARERQPVIVNNVRSDPDFLPNPLLPETRSEMAVPMIVGDKVLGVFDVQSDQHGGFSREDASIYSTLAAQVGVALQNARLYVEQASTVTQLRELDRLKSSFLANMSHELRTPLNSILGFSDVMLDGLDGPLTETMENDLKLISRNGQHLLSLINDVLDMAKITAGKMNLNIERFSLHEVLTDVVNITAPLARDKALALQLEADTSSDLEIEADRTRLRQVMINLVGNAIKFTEAGQVTLSTVRQNGHIRINVRDTGIGVPPGQAQLIFEEFSQVDTSTTRKTGGTGLGLPISRKLIELHGGQLWAESTGVRGEGSTFIIELPVTREAKHD